MEMGPLLQAIADGDTVAFVYEMYLTPKGMENAPTFTMMATEFNTLKWWVKNSLSPVWICIPMAER